MKPNVSYVVSAWLIAPNGGSASLVAQGYPALSASSPSYGRRSLAFTTGPTQTSLQIRLQAPRGQSAAVHVDDVLVVEAPNRLGNPGFEQRLSYWWSCTYGWSYIYAGEASVRHGLFAVGLHPRDQSATRCAQTVSVQPNTSYVLSGYIKSSGAASTIGVTGLRSLTSSQNTYAYKSGMFTTGASTTSVEVYLKVPAGAAGYANFDSIVLAMIPGTTTTGPGSWTPTPTGTGSPATPVPTVTPTPTAIP